MSLYCAMEGQTSSDDMSSYQGSQVRRQPREREPALDTPKKRDLPASNGYLGRVRSHNKEN